VIARSRDDSGTIRFDSTMLGIYMPLRDSGPALAAALAE
jgi:hypothetical protein